MQIYHIISISAIFGGPFFSSVVGLKPDAIDRSDHRIVGLKPDAIDPITDHHRSWRHTAGTISNSGFCWHIGNVGFQPDAHSGAHSGDTSTDAMPEQPRDDRSQHQHQIHLQIQHHQHHQHRRVKIRRNRSDHRSSPIMATHSWHHR